jgi:hypothetical protein
MAENLKKWVKKTKIALKMKMCQVSKW